MASQPDRETISNKNDKKKLKIYTRTHYKIYKNIQTNKAHSVRLRQEFPFTFRPRHSSPVFHVLIPDSPCKFTEMISRRMSLVIGPTDTQKNKNSIQPKSKNLKMWSVNLKMHQLSVNYAENWSQTTFNLGRLQNTSNVSCCGTAHR